MKVALIASLRGLVLNVTPLPARLSGDATTEAAGVLIPQPRTSAFP
jgi:hypothetical protein